MNGQPLPPGKSKTDLRRGHFTPGHAGTAKTDVRVLPKATSHDEQSALFDLSQEPAPQAHDEQPQPQPQPQL